MIVLTLFIVVALCIVVALQLFTIHRQRKIMDQLDDLVAKVAEIEGVEASVVAALTGLSDYIRSHSGIDPAVRAALGARLDAIKQGLADAVAANPVPPAA